ncbi:MAG TPA: DUF1573 domain-containing protein, partial [Taishania sp.]|nr:DUF1573 domain-containing protein [Taishania sp.]
VDQGVKDLFLFRDLLLEELQKGARIKVGIRGFASPLAKTEYNVNLTKRRISSLINHLKEYQNGVFMPYINGTAPNGGQVLFEQIPFGEYNANQLISDNPNDTKNSVYSRVAAAERKIEIQSVTYLDAQDIFPLSVVVPVFNAGVLPSGTLIKAQFEIKNESDKTHYLKLSELNSKYFKVIIPNSEIGPGQSQRVMVEFTSDGFVGHTVKTAYIAVEGFTEELKLMISMELR